ncbi:MAG TPA: hypothetical protein VG870_11010 [Chitinophagaceae bacterium]|nr:hypothetical protein [Chitinophagaceae bacterium]
MIKSHFDCNHGGFRLHEGNREMVEALCLWFSRDEKFAQRGYSTKKGIMLQGASGLGKTETIRAISEHPRYPIRIFSMIKLARMAEDEGGLFTLPSGLVLLDDVGSEPARIKHFGTERNVFQELIEISYFERRPFHKILITTNLDGDEIEERYGYRVRSRLREMFNVIQVTGEDMRR